MAKAKILIIEDDKDINELLFDHLSNQGFEVHSSGDGLLAKDLILSTKFDIYLIDWMLPNINGLQLCEIIRQRDSKTPVLFLTAKSDQESLIKGLESGANDFIKKPFSLAELTARVNANLRIMDLDKSIEYKTLNLNKDQRTVTISSEKIKLTKSEFILLTCLLENKDHVLDRDFLIKNLQGDSTVVTSRTVDTHMTGLRKKITIYSKNIISIRGIGYMFEG